MKSKLIAIAVLLLSIPMFGYVAQTNLDINGNVVSVRWATSEFPLEWRMNPIVSSSVTGSREQAAVFREAFQEWDDISTAAISFTEGAATDPSVKPGLDRINLITTNVTAVDFNSSALGLTGAFSFTGTGIDQTTGTVVEFAGQIIDADIIFNPDIAFSTSETVPVDIIDLQSVATHEIGHLLGLDHSNILSSTMFPRVLSGVIFPRDVQFDDRIGLSTIYPATSFSSLGSLGGTVRTTANTAVFGAMVVALDPNGQAAASTITDPNGQFTIEGLPEGTYTVYAEPMNQPLVTTDVFTLSQSYPGETVNTDFTVRFR